MNTDKLKKQFIQNLIYNILGSILLTGTVQAVLYPLLAASMSKEDFGVAIFLLGLANLFTAIFGCSLHDCRLKLHQEYIQKNTAGDYSLLFYIGAAANIAAVIVFSKLYYNEIAVPDLVMLGAISLFSYLKLYFSVHFRLIFDFKKIFVLSLICAAGYLLGAFLANRLGIWQLSFLFGEFAGAAYVFFTSPIAKERPKATELFHTTSNIYLSLIFMQLLFNIPLYADKMLIYPILGADDLAVYNTASFFGKTLGAVSTPISTVLLSHYSREKNITLKGFWTINAVIFVVSILLIGLSQILAGPVTGIFYPTIIGPSVPFLFLANTAVIIFYAAGLIYPAILRFCSVKYQLVVQSITVAIYISLSVVLKNRYALAGFCYAMLITNILYLLMLLVLGSASIQKQQIKIADDTAQENP